MRFIFYNEERINTMIFDKKINLSLNNMTPYDLTFKENALKWGRITQRVDEIKAHGNDAIIIANKNNTSIIEGTLTYTVNCPLKQVELVLQVAVSQGKPFVFHAELTVEGRRVNFVPVSERERLQINISDDENPDTWETEYFEKLNIVSLAHQ